VWVSRHPLNNSLAVFIHGIWGSRWTTWRSYLDFFQRLPTDQPELRSYDVYLFTYPTPFLGSEPPLREIVVPELRMFLESQAPHYDTVALVCHSQGGVLAKLYILEELLQDRGQRLKVDLIVTLNTPHRGASLRNPIIVLGIALGRCLKAPVIRKFYLLRQLADLAPNSANIRFLEEHWDAHVSHTPGTGEADRKYIKSIAICGLQDWLVSNHSAEGFYADQMNATFNGHHVDSEALANYVGYLLSGYENPADLNRELEQIYSIPQQLAQHRDNWIREASTIMAGHGLVPETFIAARAHCFAHEFRRAFERHPSRKLTLLNAFRTYVHKMLLD
jgi:pimeloyl-ACP methyl ester carboxylesterase